MAEVATLERSGEPDQPVPPLTLRDGQPLRLQSHIETASRIATILVILLSVSGFLVVSVYDSRFGFIQMNPFRPRTLAAGAWFIFAMAIPVTAAGSYVGWKQPSWKQMGEVLFPYWFACQFSALLLLQFFIVPPTKSAQKPVHFHLSDSMLIALELAAIIALVVVATSKKFPSWLSISASTALSVLFVYNASRSLVDGGFSPFYAIELWVFAIGVFTAVELKTRRWSLGDVHWLFTLIFGLGALGVFARDYYPHIDAAMGGGNPVPITIFFSKDSPILSNRAEPAFLIDESDTGFYVLGKEDEKATFIPRGDVALVYFSGDLSKFSLPKEK